MSRIGNKQINIPAAVKLKVEDNRVYFEGPKGKLNSPIPPGISVEQKDGALQFERSADDGQARAYHGLARALANNCLIGVTEGYQKKLSIKGVGYRVNVNGKTVELHLGYSHPISYELPEGITAQSQEDRATKTIMLTIEGIDKQLVGQTAAEIRKLRKPEPYKGKGIRYFDEHIKLKAGKTGK
ncbi:MAG: 50S ribosomal protein L6 [Acidobacteria bacterium]|nr:MAG: 50S ribosomal protein L6 [Acidobacteriota bacterium]PIE89994.1 MAG: 50S ribosomal protein L6 [Acidobacteriota bacterium]